MSGIGMAAQHIYERNGLGPDPGPFKFHDCAHARPCSKREQLVINVRFEVNSIASHSPFLIGPAITRSRELRAKKDGRRVKGLTPVPSGSAAIFSSASRGHLNQRGDLFALISFRAYLVSPVVHKFGQQTSKPFPRTLLA